MRRNLLIAQTFAGAPFRATTLLIAGSREAGLFAVPPGVDCLTLPGLGKAEGGEYRVRSLDVPLPDLTNLRAKAIHAALAGFEPDVLIVDKVPRGAAGELDSTLEELRAGGRTRCVLGLREVLDEPATVRREWESAGNEQAIRQFYDAIWVYGDPAVYDPVYEYGFSHEVARKVQYTGYLDPRERLRHFGTEEMEPLKALGLPPGRLVLCVVGGGQDGARLAEVFADVEFPPDTNAVLLTGPFLPLASRQRLFRRTAVHPRFRVLDFVVEPEPLLQCADRVIAMGGYNTVCEILSLEKRALIVPRVEPRQEQLIRAQRLREFGLLEMLHPDEVTPEALAAWLTRDVQSHAEANRPRGALSTL
jgi:predicted glycosyltransferase